MNARGWTDADLPDLSGAVAVVTGANSGLGLYTTLQLARHGCRVVLACRDVDRGRAALARVLAAAPRAELEVRPLDLAALTSVRQFAAGWGEGGQRLDLLVNNAGVMAVPPGLTADGFERQLGTNHLGHFALTGLLLPALLRGGIVGGPARVVTVSSNAHRMGRLHRDDLMLTSGYTPWRAYGQSKLANLLFTAELQRRADAAGVALLALAAHPGWSATNLSTAGPLSGRATPVAAAFRVLEAVLAQPGSHGAWPTLRAAADPQAQPGDYYGPAHLAQQRGPARRVDSSARAQDADDAAWLWQRSAQLTGVDYPALAPA